MKVLLVPDSMKDCLSAIEAASIMKNGILEVFPSAEISLCPLSDGGEGLIDVLYEIGIGCKISVLVEDPLGRTITAEIMRLHEDSTAFVIEMAQAAGLELLKPHERNPMQTSTRGVGQMIAKAVELGANKIYVGLGGSATHDLGCGMVHALGGLFYNKQHEEIAPTGNTLIDIAQVELSNLIAMNHVEFIGVTDVKTVLLGEDGAAKTFAGQKGAGLHDIKKLEAGGEHLASLLSGDNHLKEGSGSAGGMGFGLVTFLKGTLLTGLSALNRLVLLDEKIINADLVLTLEGKTDSQTLLGKLPHSVSLMAKEYNKKVIHFTGSWDKDIMQQTSLLFDAVMPIQDQPMSAEESIRNAKTLLKNAVVRCFKLIQMGSDLV
jgi:glycerate 2-kinase